MYCSIYTGNRGNGRSSPTAVPIEEEGSENIYDQPHTSTECSSPPPTKQEYYNQSVILRHYESQQTSEASATVHAGTIIYTPDGQKSSLDR